MENRNKGFPEGKIPDEINVSENVSESAPVKKRKVMIIVVAILMVIAVILGALCIRYWHIVRLVVNPENIGAYIDSLRYSKEDLEKKMDDNKSKMEQIAEENPLINIRGDLTSEEVEALNSGEITKEDARRLVQGEVTLEELRETYKENETTPSDESGSVSNNEEEVTVESADKNSENTPTDKDKAFSDKNSGKTDSGKETEKADKSPPKDNSAPVTQKPSNPKKPQTTEEKVQDRVSELVSELYVVQADFISRLEAIGDRAYEDYKATRYDRTKVMSIVDSYTATVGALETECDNKVKSLISELEAELDKVGGDKSLAKDIQKYYYTEKKLKKSYYLDKLDDEDYK